MNGESHLKKRAGVGITKATQTIASGGIVQIDPSDHVVPITAASAITAGTANVLFACSRITPGRKVTLKNVGATNAITIPIVAYSAGLAVGVPFSEREASNIQSGFTSPKNVLQPGDHVTFVQWDDGTWSPV